MTKQHILISLEPRHAQNVFSGVKSVELRRRPVAVDPGDVMWIYSKRPRAEVLGWTEIKGVRCASPSSIWKSYGAQTAVTRKEFFEYFSGRSVAYAIELANVSLLESPVTLERLRAAEKDFCPPQFFKRLHPTSACFEKLAASSRSERP